MPDENFAKRQRIGGGDSAHSASRLEVLGSYPSGEDGERIIYAGNTRMD